MKNLPHGFIPLTKPRKTSAEMGYIQDVINSGGTWGGGKYSNMCSEWINSHIGGHKALITTSATDALEMAALLLNIEPGDEVIMPSFTFVSTANAFVLRGGVPVFVDIDEKTLNVDVGLIENAITNKTKAILVMNYAGFSCDIDLVKNIANKYNLFVVEDAAQSVLAEYKDKPLGTFGDLSCFSFHGTKNISCGEGGALIINNPALYERASIIFEKGTNRNKFLNGEVDKYTWVDLGSSFLASEISCSYLFAQLENASSINEYRINNWNFYHSYFTNIASDFELQLIQPEKYSKHNGHIYFILLQNPEDKRKFISYMNDYGIQCASHYVPLHNSVGGLRYSRVGSAMDVTNSHWDRLVRLPMWSELDMPLDYILTSAKNSLDHLN
jgi:dTDP-4-amino-4,6-dideoxygalactose transaminase